MDTCYYITNLRESLFQTLINTVCGPPDGDSVEGRGVRGKLVAAPQQELVQGPGAAVLQLLQDGGQLHHRITLLLCSRYNINIWNMY